MAPSPLIARPAQRFEPRRKDLFAALATLGFANGLVIRVSDSGLARGWTAALMDTFDISPIVWVAMAMAVARLREGGDERASRPDMAVGLLCLAACLVPVAQASWLAMTGLGLYLAWAPAREPALRDGGRLLLAITIPMLWSRLLLSAFSGPVLTAEAALVASLVGTEHVENAVLYPGGSGVLWIAPTCSSLVTVALALLCWVAFMVGARSPWSARAAGWGLLACLAAMALNVARLAVLALNPAEHAVLHGPVGNAAMNWLTTAALLAVCWVGVRRLGAGHRGVDAPDRPTALPAPAPAPTRLMVFLAIALLAGVALKQPGAAPDAAPDPRQASIEATMDFLNRNGLAVRQPRRDLDLAILRGTGPDGCRLAVAILAPQGWHVGVVRHMAGPQDEVFFVYSGTVSESQPVWRTRLDLYEALLLRRLGLTPAHRPVLGVVADRACRAKSLPWGELATLPDGGAG
ncbi:hypothetical protein [Azorhizobium doebereinerae]|uniref:hypothetical protein n=1 Tax=Azorhizobium doebereinerae TaxID=281091 RepID=UPI00040857F0|nr:hypothetical protein [Azorhizobium doebereinerae]